MKPRPSHFVIVFIVFVAGFILFAMNHKPAVSKPTSQFDAIQNPVTQNAPSRDEQFLADVRREAADIPVTTGVGNVPPAGSDENLVPVIEVETDEFDMGLITNAEPTSKPFTVYNRGRLPLKIFDIATSCACTQGSIPESRNVIPPGEEATITITVDPYRVPGFISDKVLTITSNDPNNGQIQVKVHADVEPEFVIEPEAFDFGKVAKGDSPAQTVRFRQLQETPIEITEVNSFGRRAPEEAGDELQVSFERVPEADWGEPGKVEYLIHATLSPNTPAGILHRLVYLISDLPRVVAMQIPLRAEVVASYVIDPVAPKPVVIKGDADAVGVVTVTADEPVTIENVGAPEGVIEALVREQSAPNEAHLDLTVAPAAPAGAIQEMVTFDVVVGEQRYSERVSVRAYKVL